MPFRIGTVCILQAFNSHSIIKGCRQRKEVLVEPIKSLSPKRDWTRKCSISHFKFKLRLGMAHFLRPKSTKKIESKERTSILAKRCHKCLTKAPNAAIDVNASLKKQLLGLQVQVPKRFCAPKIWIPGWSNVLIPRVLFKSILRGKTDLQTTNQSRAKRVARYNRLLLVQHPATTDSLLWALIG